MRKTFTKKIQKILFDNKILNTIHKRENRVMFIKAHDEFIIFFIFFDQLFFFLLLFNKNKQNKIHIYFVERFQYN